MKRVTRDEVDGPTEHPRQLVIQVIDLPAKAGAGGQLVENINVAVWPSISATH
jgi:hypothetical protein